MAGKDVLVRTNNALKLVPILIPYHICMYGERESGERESGERDSGERARARARERETQDRGREGEKENG